MSKHSTQKGQYFNYVHDAAQLYWAARWFELNPTLTDKDRMIDELLIRRLRDNADAILEQAANGLEMTYKNVTDIGQEEMRQLAEERAK
jgi:hypothetical protein